MTVSAGAKKPKKTGGNFVRKPPTFVSKKKPPMDAQGQPAAWAKANALWRWTRPRLI